MPEPTIALQIKYCLFQLGKLSKDNIHTAVFKHYTDNEDATYFDVVKFEALNLGSNCNTWMLTDANNATLMEGVSLWTGDYWTNRIIDTNEFYVCKINNKRYILTIDEVY